MNFDDFIAIIESTSIELYNSEWDQLETAFNKWKDKQEQEKENCNKSLT